jgi:D-alanine transaminase
MRDIAYVNGAFSALADAKVSIEDRGFQFGDGVYEVIAVYGGRPFLLDRHMRRLRTSAAAIGIPYDFDANPLDAVIAEGLRKSEYASALVYIQLTRGAAPRSHVIPAGLRPTVVLTFRPLPEVSAEYRERGAALMTAPDDRWGRCYIKAITLLPNILARNEAVRQGFDDALFVASDGEVRECTSANIFLVRGDSIVTPPRDESVLHGVTQDFLQECAVGVGMHMVEERFDVGTLRAAEEVFMSSTSIEVLGVSRVDEHVVASAPGSKTRRLFDEFRSRSRSS